MRTRRAILGGLAAGAAAHAALAAQRAEPAKRLRLAVAQCASDNGAIDQNLARATALLDRNAAQRPDLVLFPEFLATGYALDNSVWQAGEPRDGPTARWLRAQSRRHRCWLGATYLEADGEDFFNTFVLTTPEGNEAGRVRKETPAGAEAFFFKGQANPHYIDTALGRIGVGICLESYTCILAEHFAAASPDLILLPHSFPDMRASGGLLSPPGTHVARWHASFFGAPTAMSNKTGPWSTAVIGGGRAEGLFPGGSSIVAAGGRALVQMDPNPGLAVAEVEIQIRPRWPGEASCPGVGIAPLALGRAADATGPRLEDLGAAAYAASAARRAAASTISGAGP